MISKSLPRWFIYALAVVFTVAVVIAREYIAMGIDNRPMLILFMLPVILSSLLGGLGPGLLSTALAALGTDYFALPPYHSFIIDKSENLFQWSFLIISGVGISLISEELHRAQKTIEINQTRLNTQVSSVSPDLFFGNKYRLISHFLAYFIPVFAVICIGGYLYASAEIRLKQQAMRSDAQEAVRLATNSLTTTLGDMSSDVLFLANLPRLIAAINTPTPFNLANLAEVLSVYSTTQGVYDQIRWIDESGMEKVRVTYENGQGRIVPPEQLQDKSKRPFFMRASTLQAGTVYLSNLDLNVEHEQVEIPYKPVIRAAIPLFNLQGLRRGIIVANYHGRKMLDDMIAAIGKRNKHLVMLNRDGYYLYSINAEDTWGFMLNKPTTLGNKDPDAWANMQTSDRGTRTTASGTWLWDSLHPMQILQKGKYLKISNQQNVTGEYDYFWHVAMLTPAAELQTISWGIWQRTGISMGLLSILAILASISATLSKQKIAQLDKQLQERAKVAESATIAKSHFIANMSHEIRTPMNAILGLAYLLEKTKLPGDANEMVRKIRKAGHSLLGIINEILDFSKIESGKLEIESAPFRLGDVLDSLATIMSANAVDKELELIISPPPNKTSQLVGDALRLEQVLINLTSNAIKFTDYGHVALSVDIVGEDDRQVTLRFAVRDTGIGISPEQQLNIFAPFSQADGSTSRRFGGTGLGLTISRRLVSSMGGELQVTSVLGSGSEFWFVLSFERELDSWMAAPEMAKLDLLIADDNPIAREVLVNIADGLGWKAFAVSSGEAAISHVQMRLEKSALRQVLVLDFKMPGMDGLTTAKTIREQLKSVDDPIIIMVTAYSTSLLHDHPDSHLADAVLTKPVTASSLYNAVSRGLRVRQGGEAHQPSYTGLRLGGLRILVVDDSDINREVAQLILVSEGASVILANDGREAVDWLQTHPQEVDIVLMDVQMPIMNGYEATRQIRRFPALAELPVIALTAGAFIEQQELAHAAGMNSFLSKPFDVDAAIALIIKLTGRIRSVAATDKVLSFTEAPNLHQNFPGLAVGRGLKTWKDPTVYKQYLRKFGKEYADCVQKIMSVEQADAASLAHKLKGAAASLALDEVAKCANEVDQSILLGEHLHRSLMKLQAALDEALRSIDQYAAFDISNKSHQLEAFNTKQLTELLKRMILLLEADNIVSIRPLLIELEKLLSPDTLESLNLAIENYDYRGADTAIRSIAGQYLISLGD